ncbi:amidohydrolase family protein [Parahaliea maris]|uniref:amidohydrolase family protein n=1 Tax=Parahaliea maris TaxID=2716870 RepID=UPI00164F0B87|nr:amidohydrolase family protein [Parahaliea maris]
MRLENGHITDIRPRHGSDLPVSDPAHRWIEGNGATLLPGLHDHHLHLMAYAAALDSVHCGPPAVQTEEQLAGCLRDANGQPDAGWLRGIAYHASVAGDIDRHWLDRYIPDRPVRVQHRGGRLWVLNSCALEALNLDQALNQDQAQGELPPGLERSGEQFTGRLYEGDAWLRARVPRKLPDLARASCQLARYGITGITDTTPANGLEEWRLFAAAQDRGELGQRVRMMGGPDIALCHDTEGLQRGELKVHLLESQLPELDRLCDDIAAAHARERAVAIHCVTRTELVFALAALDAAGTVSGDRIEHASVCPPEQLEEIRRLNLRVVTQPHFIEERGDHYLDEVEAEDQPWLYRAAAFLEAGVPLAGGSDTPFGDADPWRLMRAAVSRRTLQGRIIGASEALTPEQALALFLSPPQSPGLGLRHLQVGAPADLCLLKAPWAQVRTRLDANQVRITWRGGQCIFDAAAT